MGYAEAIEQQARLIRVWHSPFGLAMGRQEEKRQREANGMAVTAEDFCWAMDHELGNAEPYFVARPICRLLAASFRSFPDIPLADDLLPTQAGFVWLEEPIAVDGPLATVPEVGDAVRLAAFSWEWVSMAMKDETQPNKTGVSVTFYAPFGEPGIPPLMMLGNFAWVFGDRWQADWGHPQPDGSRKGNPASARMRGHFIQLCSFVRQAILTTSTQRIQNRTVRKRLARTLAYEPVVKVVELRRRDYQQRDESEGGTVEWSCQWLVRGHWHRYHTREGLQPRWVMPYVKGDPDKPLRVAEKVAYEVVR